MVTRRTEVFSFCPREEMRREWKILTESTFQSSATNAVVIPYHKQLLFIIIIKLNNLSSHETKLSFSFTGYDHH